MTSLGFGVSTIVFLCMIAFGLGTFGANTAGNIINNYSVTDGLAGLCRVAIAFSIIFTYPLAFVGLKVRR